MNAPCRTTVAPSTPSTAAANGRTVNRRGSTAGWSLASSNRTNAISSGTTAIAASRPEAALAGHADRGEERDEQRRRAGQGRGRRSVWVRAGRSRPRHRGRRGPVRRHEPDHDRGEERDRHGDDEQRPPAEQADQHATDERSDGGTGRHQHVEQSRMPRHADRAATSRGRAPPTSSTPARRSAPGGRAPARGTRTTAPPRPAATRARRRPRRRGRRAAGRTGRRGCRWPAARP